MKISEDEAEKISDLGNALRKLTAEKLDSFLSGAEVGLKYETDTDDNNWKRLCDIARLQVNAKTRYLQSKAIQDKARERVESAADRARLRTSSSDEIVNDSGHQNRVSLLRGGGEAMKKFQESAQMVIFKNMETEADTKAAKDKEVFDEASAAKDKAVAEYKRVTEARISKFEAENKQATDDFNEICEVMKSGIVKINNARFKSMEKCPLDKETVTFEWLVNDIQKWVQSTKKSVEESHDKALASESGNSQDPASLESQDGFKLGLALISSKSVDKLLELQGTEKSVPDLLIEPEESLEDATHSEQLNSNEDTKQNESHFEAKNEEKSTNKVEPATSPRSLRKSFTAPENSHAWVKAQGSFESAESNPDDADVQVKPVSEPPEIVTFRETFWSKTQNGEEPPEVLRVINCVFRPREMGGFLLSNLHGRLYTTKESIYFLAWEGRNFVMTFKKIVDIQKDKGLGFIAANDTLVVTYLSSEGNKAAFILSRLEAIDSTFEHLRNLLEAAEVQMEAEEIIKNPEDMALPPPVPPDKILKKMEIVLSKTIKNISVERVYEQCWSEGNGTSAPRFYGPWLESEGCFDFLVKHWETAEPGSEGFINEWCKDTYSQRRLVTFKFKRTSHLYIGPPVAFVKQMHYCRVEGKDKCILHMSASFEGIPYSDAFVVEMRWVGSRVGLNDLKIEVGLFVVFKKPTILKNQIKAGTINETKVST